MTPSSRSTSAEQVSTQSPDRDAVNVPAQNCVNGIFFRVAHNGGFKFSDETDGVFHALLHVSAQRPIAETEPPADEVDRRIQRKQNLISNVAGERQQLHVLHDSVQL